MPNIGNLVPCREELDAASPSESPGPSNKGSRYLRDFRYSSMPSAFAQQATLLFVFGH